MPIKRSTLEQKWYFRIAKVIFLTLPFLVALYFHFSGKMDVVATVQKNYIYAAIGLAAYYIILAVAWRVFLYLVFGGMEDDTKTKANTNAQAASQPPASQAAGHGAISPEDKKEIGFMVFLLIMIILIYIIVNYKSPDQILPNIPVNVTTCVPTGCGKQWYSSCTHKCYASQSECRKTLSYEYGCASGGFCRQCP